MKTLQTVEVPGEPTSAALTRLCDLRMRCCEVAAKINPLPSTDFELVRVARSLYEWTVWEKAPGIPGHPPDKPD